MDDTPEVDVQDAAPLLGRGVEEGAGELIVPDEDKSLDEGAIHPWSHGHTKEYFGRLVG
ncbi:hypothetical protein ABZ085_02915, partial [Streptomyces albidoflavus]